jgi:hypothetical protein
MIFETGAPAKMFIEERLKEELSTSFDGGLVLVGHGHIIADLEVLRRSFIE